MNSVYDTIESEAVVTGPTVGQALVSLANIPGGFYRFDVTYSTSGTSTGADSDNVALNVPGNPAYVMSGTQGTPANSDITQTVYATLPAALNAVTLTAIGAGGAAALYHVSLKVTLWPRPAINRAA